MVCQTEPHCPCHVFTLSAHHTLIRGAASYKRSNASRDVAMNDSLNGCPNLDAALMMAMNRPLFAIFDRIEATAVCLWCGGSGKRGGT